MQNLQQPVQQVQTQPTQTKGVKMVPTQPNKIDIRLQTNVDYGGKFYTGLTNTRKGLLQLLDMIDADPQTARHVAKMSVTIYKNILQDIVNEKPAIREIVRLTIELLNDLTPALNTYMERVGIMAGVQIEQQSEIDIDHIYQIDRMLDMVNAYLNNCEDLENFKGVVVDTLGIVEVLIEKFPTIYRIVELTKKLKGVLA